MRSPRRPAVPVASLDAGVSEVLGTVMLTAVTIVLVSGFAITVFGTMTGEDDPAPTASFTIVAAHSDPSVAGDEYVRVSMREGTSFLLNEARIVMAVNGTALADGYLESPFEAGRFSPGDTMRFNLTSGEVGEGANFTFIAADADANRMIGYAMVSVPAAGADASFDNDIEIASVTFDPTPLTADGATTTLVTVLIDSPGGLGLVETVTIDLSDVGGSTLTLVDDGTGGDAVANDGIFSGSFSASSDPPTLTPTLTVTATDVLGHSDAVTTTSLTLTESDLLSGVEELIANATSATNILGVGGISRNVPSSSTLQSLEVLNFTWRDVEELENDVILYRVTDLQDTTKAWAVAIYFDDCAVDNDGGPYGAIKEIVYTIDGDSDRASWTPTSPTNCWTVDYGTTLVVTNLNSSVNATGASPTWNVEVQDSAGNEIAGDPSDYAYEAAGIGTINQGIVPFFGDVQPTANPHGALDDLGLGTAVVDWVEWENRDPTADIALTVTAERTVLVSAAGSDDPDGDSLTYKWLWGDGSSSTGAAATHTYGSVGEYTIRLYANDSAGGSDWVEETVGAAPTAVFNSTVLGLSVYASASGSTDPNGLALTYAWAWGDGGTSTGTPALYTYAANATDTVTLTVTNLFGTSGELTASTLHNGTLFLTCNPTAAVGTVTNCHSAKSASDSAAVMSLAESANSSRQQLYVHIDVTGFAESGKTHTVDVRARQASGTAEALAFQVKDWSTGTWSTPSGFTWSSTTASTATHVLTANQWNNGNPDFRFVDSACTSTAYTCSSASDSNAATWAVDWVRVISS